MFLRCRAVRRKLDGMDLVALEEIKHLKHLKHRCLRCVDTKDWEGLADTLAVDVTADYGTPVCDGPLHFAGRDALVAFLGEKLGPGMITTHLPPSRRSTSRTVRRPEGGPSRTP